MTTKLTRTEIHQGVFLSAIGDPKFKHNQLSVNLIVPLSLDTVGDYAVLPFLMRKGCKPCPDFTELNRRLDDLYGATLTADVGKVGASQIVTIGIKTVDDRFTMQGEEIGRQCAALVRDTVFSPLISDGAFPSEDTALERRFLIDTIEAEINDKRSYAVAQLRALMDPGGPAALRRYGTVEAARRITPQSAAAAYARLMDNAVAQVLFIGPGDPTGAFDVLKKAFAGFNRNPLPFSEAGLAFAQGALHERTERLDVAQSKLALGFRTGPKGSPAQQAAMRTMAALYGGAPFSKLFLNVREKLSLCYYCVARYDRSYGIMTVDCGVEQGNVQRAKEEILHQLEEVQSGAFDDEMLENTRLLLKNSLRAVGDSTSALEEWYLNRIISGEITTPQQELLLIDEVTREDVVAAARSVSLDAVYLLTQKEDTPDAP